MPGSLDLSLDDRAVIIEYFHHGIVIGKDGSLLADRGRFLLVGNAEQRLANQQGDSWAMLEAPLQIDYFYGIGLHYGEVFYETYPEKLMFYARDMISLDWRYGFCFRRITHLQKRFRRRRAERYATHMVRQVMIWAKCVARQSPRSKGADRLKAFPHAALDAAPTVETEVTDAEVLGQV